MSESFFHFKIRCPKCGYVNSSADGFETDDWVEVFVFSGYSDKSYKLFYEDYKCPKCNEKFDRDMLYLQKYIETDEIERIKSYLSRMLEYVIERKGIYDHGWDPDVERAVVRYSYLYPQDMELANLRKLYSYAYHNPKMLTKFEPIKGTKIIKRSMILCPKALKKIYLPDGLEEIDDETFCDCYHLRDAFIPRTVFRIGKAAFKNCTYLKSVHSSDNLKIIDDEAFSDCVSLEKLFLPDGLKKIGDRSFANCKSMKELYIPCGCEKIGKNIFGECSTIIIKGKKNTVAEEYAVENGIEFVPDLEE